MTRAWIAFSIAVLLPASATAGPTVQVTVNGREIAAEVIANQGGVCWFAEADGRYTAVRVKDVHAFTPLRRPITPVSTVEMRASMRKEHGREFDVQSIGRHVVVADRKIARRAAMRCDEINRAFRSYFGKRSVSVRQSEYPLVAVIVRDQASFAKAARADGVTATSSLAGYYLRTTNRVLLYDPGYGRTASAGTPEATVARLPWTAVRSERESPIRRLRPLPSPHPAGSLPNANLDATLVHETVHQLAFNMGLHSRTGSNPKWVVEGLATMLEPDTVRRSINSRDEVTRVNRERLAGFARRTRHDWQPGRLATIVATDERFDRAALDAYAEAWGLTFFLAETRSSKYTAYLRTLATRQTLHDSTPAERVTDFQRHFGTDLARLEVKWLRYMDDLASRAGLD